MKKKSQQSWSKSKISTTKIEENKKKQAILQLSKINNENKISSLLFNFWLVICWDFNSYNQSIFKNPEIPEGKIVFQRPTESMIQLQNSWLRKALTFHEQAQATVKSFLSEEERLPKHMMNPQTEQRLEAYCNKLQGKIDMITENLEKKEVWQERQMEIRDLKEQFR